MGFNLRDTLLCQVQYYNLDLILCCFGASLGEPQTSGSHHHDHWVGFGQHAPWHHQVPDVRQEWLSYNFVLLLIFSSSLSATTETPFLKKLSSPVYTWRVTTPGQHAPWHQQVPDVMQEWLSYDLKEGSSVAVTWSSVYHERLIVQIAIVCIVAVFTSVISVFDLPCLLQ